MKSSFNCRKTTCNKLVKQWFFKGLGSWFTLQSHSSLGFYFLQVLCPWFWVLSPTSDMGLGSQALILTKDHESWVSLFRYAVIVTWFNLLTRSIIMMYTIEPSQQTFVLVRSATLSFKTSSRHLQDIFKT